MAQSLYAWGRTGFLLSEPCTQVGPVWHCSQQGWSSSRWDEGIPRPCRCPLASRHREQEANGRCGDKWEEDSLEGIILQGCQEMRNFLLPLLRLEHDPVWHIIRPLHQPLWLRGSHGLFLSFRRHVPSEAIALSFVPGSLLSVLTYLFNKL